MKSEQSLLRYLEKQAGKIETCLPEVVKKPSVTRVHELRVAVRRTRSVLWVLRQVEEGPHFKRLNRHLRKIGKVLGKKRELDVAIHDAESYGLKADAIRRRRKRARRAVEKLLDGKRKHLVRDLEELKENHVQSPQLSPALRALSAQLKGWLGNPFQQQGDIHRFRILLKKTRYVLEALDRPTQPILELQDVLGRLHDLEILGEFKNVEKNVRKNVSKNVQGDRVKLIRRLHELADLTVKFALRTLSDSV